MIRIKTIATLVDKDSKVIDIGTDHAYLPIYLYKNNITTKITGSDISNNALKIAYNNLLKYHLENKIKLIKSDGFKDIKEKYDIAIISGMGTNTIKSILDYDKLPNTLIISSHKDLPNLRIYLNKLNYKIDKEVVVKENNIYYDIIKYIKGKEVLTKYDILVGKSNHIEYQKYLLNKYEYIYQKSKDKKYQEYIDIIKKTIMK